jgi:GlpG protein
LRQIGTLAKTSKPEVFSDHLLTMGVTSRAIQSPDGWAIWIHNEDHVAKARAELDAFQANPDDPRFLDAKQSALEARREAERLDREYRKNVRNLKGSWDGANLRRRPLTSLLVVVCVALFVAGMLSPEVHDRLWDRLGFFSIAVLRQHGEMSRGLDDIVKRGEVWRLFTPALLHVNYLHLFFNMWATVILGTIIETRRGTSTLAALVVLSALASNVGQYLYVLNFDLDLVRWGGISGVGYAMFGYLWMKGRYEPEQGMILHPSSVRIMLLWLLLGFTGILPMANGAHLVGLIVGVLFGLARF